MGLKISRFWKGIIATLVPVAQLAYSATTDGEVTAQEGVMLAVSIVGAIGVIMKANRNPTPDDVVPGYQRQEKMP